MNRIVPLALLAALPLAASACAQRGSAATEPPAQTTQAVFQVSGMNCESCELEIEEAVRRLQGVVSVRASLPDALVIVELDPAQLRAEAIESSIERLGYEAVLGVATSAPLNANSSF